MKYRYGQTQQVTLVQIFAKAFGFYLLFQVSLGRGNDSNIGVVSSFVADSFKFAFLPVRQAGSSTMPPSLVNMQHFEKSQ